MAKHKKPSANPTSLDRITRSDIMIEIDFEKENYRKLAKFASKVLDLMDDRDLEAVEHLVDKEREDLEEALGNVNVH